MKIKILQWNIKFQSNTILIANYIKNNLSEYSIINLQEVSLNAYLIIKELFPRHPSIFSLNYRSPGHYEGLNRKMGVVTMITQGKITKSNVLSNTVFPERTLYSEIEINTKAVRNLTFHSLTGVDYKKAKSSNFASIASFLHQNPIDIMTFDANEPQIDSFNQNEIVCFNNNDNGFNAGLLLGNNRIHNLQDSFKEYAKKTNSPLESGYTYIAGGKKRRYDHIFCNKEWEIIASESQYIESNLASSDHAMVITEVEM